jgi:hypothetical protein
VSLADVAQHKKIKKQNISNDLNGMSWTCKRLFGTRGGRSERFRPAKEWPT